MDTKSVLKQVLSIRIEALKFARNCIKEEFKKKVDTLPKIIWAKYTFKLVESTYGDLLGKSPTTGRAWKLVLRLYIVNH